jgi:hypothetical protein
MPESFGIETVKERLVAMQVEVDDSDDKTIRFSAEPAIHGTIFGGFGDFDLDLSCLSPPTSPAPSTSNLPPDTPSPPSTPILSRTTSFVSQISSFPQKKSKKKLSLPHLAATTAGLVTGRGSWPLIKYTGRGTPIDRNRRLEWGGFSGEGVAEDGTLFSVIRSISSFESASRGDGSVVHEQPPELGPILIEGLGTDKSEDWDSIMKTVLGPTEVPPASNLTEGTVPQADSELEVDPKGKSAATVESRFMSPEQMEELNNGLEMDLGLNAALDLGLGRRGGMNWFDLGLLPKSPNGHETSSVYSSRAPSTRRPSPPPSVRASEHRSTTSTKAEGNGGIITKTDSHRWWRRFLQKVQSMITVHRNRF